MHVYSFIFVCTCVVDEATPKKNEKEMCCDEANANKRIMRLKDDVYKKCLREIQFSEHNIVGTYVG